jgi:hypothetical protein
MAGFFKEGERILKKISANGVQVLEYYYGLDLELYRVRENVHNDVYGVHAGGKSDYIETFIGVLVSDDFFASDNAYSGNFEEGFLYTTSQSPLVDDIISVISTDNKSRRFKIIAKESIGTQTDVITRFKLSNLGD